jgi:hypothetical protein
MGSMFGGLQERETVECRFLECGAGPSLSLSSKPCLENWKQCIRDGFAYILINRHSALSGLVVAAVS